MKIFNYMFFTKNAGLRSHGLWANKFFAIASLMLFVNITGCKKLVDVNAPITSVTSASVYQNDITATAVLTNLYISLSVSQFNGVNIPCMSLWAGLSADELTLVNTNNVGQVFYYTNALSANSGGAGTELWQNIYPFIFTCNTAINGLSSSTTLTPAVKKQLMGEAKFMRAFYYFYLVNYYGDVAMPLSTDYTVNAMLARTPKAQVYLQIIQDLKDAQSQLVDGYVMNDVTTLYPAGSAERVRPNKAAASALLARAYLYYGNLSNDATNYTNAVTQASSVISNTAYYNLTALNSVFLKNSQEAIWQWQPVTTGVTNTYDAQFYIIPSSGISSSYPVCLSNSLLNSFETGDQRKVNGNWINSVTVGANTYYYSYKYKINAVSTSAVTVPVTEYRMALRLGEQYLIRAEAEAQLGDPNAITDLNKIRNRAGLPNYAGLTDKASLLAAILHERQVELFSESGNRWLDLKRTGNIDAVMAIQVPLKGAVWNSYQQLYPVYLNDILKDPNLTQNAGY